MCLSFDTSPSRLEVCILTVLMNITLAIGHYH